MKTLKLKSILSLILLAAVVFTSCKKDDPAPKPEDEITGSWKGKYGDGANTPAVPYNFNIQSGGVLEIKMPDNSAGGTGSWTLTGNKFEGNYKYFNSPKVYLINGVYDKGANKISGTWGYEIGDHTQGNFYWNKQ